MPAFRPFVSEARIEIVSRSRIKPGRLNEMTGRIKNSRLVSSRKRCRLGWGPFLLAMVALVLLAGLSFVQAEEEMNASLTLTPGVNSVDQTPETTPSPLQGGQQARPDKDRNKTSLTAPTPDTNPSPSPTPEMSLSAPKQETEPSPLALKKMSLEQLMNLDVTSVSKQPEPYGQAPAAIEVITNDEIRRSGASSIPEALQLADNLEVAQKDSHNWSISARGFNTDLSNKLLVLIDGRNVYSPLFSGVFWDAQDYLLEDIDRIEVISGPGGTLWGANAVNGVINITSKSAKDTQGLYVEGGGGSELQDFEAVRSGGTMGPDIFYRVYGKYDARGDEDLANGSLASDSWTDEQGGFRIDAGDVSSENFTLQGDIYDNTENISTGGQDLKNGGNVLGRWSRTFSDDSNMSLQLYYDHTYFKDPVPESFLSVFVAAPAGILTDNLDTYDLDFQHHFHLDDHNNFSWGFGYRYTNDVTQAAPGLAFNPSTLNQSLYSVFAQDEIGLLSNLFLTAGSKLEHNDYTGFEFEPSARLKWDLAEGQMLWAAVSRAVRMPSQVDTDEEGLTPDLKALHITSLIDGSPDFESEVLIAYELGYRAQLRKNLSTSVLTFFNNYTDIRSTGITPGGALGELPFVFQNNLLAQTWGVEWTADYQVVNGWRLHAGYDLLNEDVWIAPGQIDLNKGLNETADPSNQVFVRASMDLPGNLELDPGFRWIDSFVYNTGGGVPGTVPSYAELDVRLAWHATGNLELSVTGQNLLQRYHLEYVISSPAPTEEISRTVYGKVAMQF
jgi:iron complex outermembrane recepter protein